MSKPDLLPCPFCGDAARKVQAGVCCDSAICCLSYTFMSEEQWNRRASLAPVDAEAVRRECIRVCVAQHWRGTATQLDAAIEALKELDLSQFRQDGVVSVPVPIGTNVPPLGNICAIGTLNGERFYWTRGHDGAIGMFPASTVEPMHKASRPGAGHKEGG